MRPRRHARHFPDRPTLWSWRGMLRAAGDPLVQTWGLVMLSFILVGSHYAGTARSREQKKLPHSPQFLTAGFVDQGQASGLLATPVSTPRPAVSLRRQSRQPALQDAEMAETLVTGARIVRDEVASAPEWRFLSEPLRRQIAESMRPGPGACTLRLSWSGEPAGNARVLRWHQSRVQRGRAAAPDFVIGNGTRSGDGAVESLLRTTPAAAAETRREVRICLIGDGQLTSSQRQSLGELIVWLEARSGAVEITAD